MACEIIGYKSSACRLQGGIRDIYFGLSSEADYKPQKDANGNITSITAVGIGNVVSLVKFSTLQGTGSAIETLEGDKWMAFTQVVTASSRGFDQDAILSLNSLSKAEVFAIVHYESGFSRLFGMDDFLRPSGGEATSGEAAADANKFTIEFSGSEEFSAPILLGSTNDLPLGTIVGGIDIDGVEFIAPQA